MNSYIDRMYNLKTVNDIIYDLENNEKSNINVFGLCDSAKVHLLYAITKKTNKSSIIVCSNEYEISKFTQDLKTVCDLPVIYLPEKKIEYFEIDAKSREEQNQRIFAINKILSDEKNIVITTVNSFLENLSSFGNGKNTSFRISLNDSINTSSLASKLNDMGYEKVELVEGKGQFAIRGDIIDIFSIEYDEPFRIELFGDDVDNIRKFDLLTQRSIENVKEFEISSASELILTSAKKEEVINKLNDILEEKNLSNNLKTNILEDIEKIRNDNYENLYDKYFHLFIDKPYTLFDYVKNKYNIYINDYENCIKRAKNEIYENEETLKILEKRESIYSNFANRYILQEDFEKELLKIDNVFFEDIKKQITNGRKNYTIEARQELFYTSSIETVLDDIKRIKKEKENLIFMMFPTLVRTEQIKNFLIDNNIKVKYIQNISLLDKIDTSYVYVTNNMISSGYFSKDLKTYLFAEPVSGSRIKKRVNNKFAETKNTKLIDNFDDLNIGDYIVHENHGIGIYRGINQINVDGVIKDYIKLEYSGSDIIYIPINQLDSVKKYICDDDTKPKVNALNSKEWAKEKAKVTKHVEQVAKELVLLYAKRNNSKGYAFSKDTPWQREFEDSFKYELTSDQEQAVKEIKEDMESDIPMDRLLCGDVGYGKTEVALRAAFKAVMDSKQVAYLVPTTVLCLQQYKTFKERMENFGIKVEMLSRFKSKSEQTKILKDLVDGKIDIIIGTHRILSKDVFFKDLGFLIIDEEHRFGVKAKEAIKVLRENIDVLSMSATPIPRTLHMSLVGIRKLSTLSEPPLERLPVRTYVLEYEAQVIKDAIEKELLRDGQVIYLDNRVDTIEQLAEKVRGLVPNARIGIAHGKMSPEAIENVMVDFMEHKIDIIVCTTILETGIDIQNANTLIIENADRLGLAQLYQIRGRVGRSSRLAYAYVTYKKNKEISEISNKRLKAIKDFTEFGSGFKIAIRDLEIRGTGNILGKEQHGHMARVGYEMYMHMLDKAIEKEKNNNVSTDVDVIAKKEIKIELNVSAYISDNYIKDPIQKIIAYQKISDIKSNEEILDLVDEFIDRYGNLPKEVENLIKIVEIRNACRKLGITRIYTKNNFVIFEPTNLKFELTNLNSNDILLTVQFEINKLMKKLKEEGYKNGQ